MTLHRGVLTCWILLLVASAGFAEEWTLETMVTRSADGQRQIHPLKIDDAIRNPWPAEYEREFQQRADRILKAQESVRVSPGNTYFENEKRTYGYLMAQALGPRGMAAIADLQHEDAQAKSWHTHTEGIDYYPAFTLKHQMRKFFYFGDLLRPEYRERMVRGARSWTEKDPLRRPHHSFEPGKQGWGPDAKNSWVDVRNTENLFLMRVTSVYLMAEHTGNRDTTAHYKDIILNYTRTLYRVGIGEWDSENYHGHSVAPLCNLHDFAQDPDVQRAAKACLDFYAAAGAVKYFRGGFNGPTKRDYNHAQPFGGSAAGTLWVWFGDAPLDNPHWESDEVHLITSAYRPPVAVMKLARKQLDAPVQLFASKPHYTATTTFDTESPPDALETQYLGRTFLMGSLAGGTRPGKTDVNGMKLLVDHGQHGGVALQGVPGPDPLFVGSPQYQEGKVSAENRVAQDRNLAIWIVRDGSSPWQWVVPPEVTIRNRSGVTFLEFANTYVALRPLGTTELSVDEALSESVGQGDRPRFPGHRVLAATGQAEGYCGVAIEVGEAPEHESLASFERAVLAAEVDSSELAQGIVRYKAADGKWLGIHDQEAAHDLGVWRNGQRHDWQRHKQALYTAFDEPSPISADWGGGRLTVRCGGSEFWCEVDNDGQVTFDNR